MIGNTGTAASGGRNPIHRARVAVVCLAWLGALAVSSPARSDDAPNWVKVSDKNGFLPRDSCGELVFNNRLWLMGGWLNSQSDPPRDVWSSADGKEWTKATDAAAWKHSDFPMTLTFKDRMWSMGGWHGGRLAHASASNAVWSSTDGADWKQETAAAGWSPRMAGAVTVFKDRMWVLGGVQKYYYGADDDLKNDVWSSADGVKWEQATAKAPWSPRAYQQAVTLGGKLYLIAGGNYLPNYQAKNDVWSTEDGVTWTLETDKAPWPPRIWFSAVTYRDRIWVLGGWSNNPSKNWGDVWTSKDGKTWEPFKTETTWKERHEHSTYVFQDRIFVVGGMSPPLQNDVWSLHVPPGHFSK